MFQSYIWLYCFIVKCFLLSELTIQQFDHTTIQQSETINRRSKVPRHRHSSDGLACLLLKLKFLS